jgi:branched-chain amino acid transport system permease protein
VRSRAAVAKAAFGAAGLVLLFLVPSLITSSSWKTIALQVAITACAALGIVLLFGYAGQISLAGGAFVGMGLYAPAIIAVKYGHSPWLGLPVAVALAMAAAAVVGYPVLRLEGLYLAMATAALNLIFVTAIGSLDFTNKTYGIAGIPPLKLFGLDLLKVSNLYYVVLVTFLVLLLLSYNLIRSPVRAMFAALHHNPQAAQLTGINVHALKLKTFVLSAAFAAVAGFFVAESLLFASPEQVSLDLSLLLLVMAVVGGIRSPAGVIAGATFVGVLPGIMPERPQTQQFLYAITFLLVVMLVPNGIGSGETWAGAWKTVGKLRRRSPA